MPITQFTEPGRETTVRDVVIERNYGNALHALQAELMIRHLLTMSGHTGYVSIVPEYHGRGLTAKVLRGDNRAINLVRKVTEDESLIVEFNNRTFRLLGEPSKRAKRLLQQALS